MNPVDGEFLNDCLGVAVIVGFALTVAWAINRNLVDSFWIRRRNKNKEKKP